MRTIIAFAVAAIVAMGSLKAQSSKGAAQIKSGTSTSFGPLKRINAGLLNVGYVEAGPADGPAVILLHDWPYDIHSYVDVAPLLASAGYRVIVPYLRGYGTTHFLSSDTFRNGQQSAVAFEGDANGAPHPDLSSYRNKFSGKHLHRTSTGGIGHNIPALDTTSLKRPSRPLPRP